VLLKDVSAEGLHFALKTYIKARPLQPEVEAANSRKKRGDFIGQETTPMLEQTKNQAEVTAMLSVRQRGLWRRITELILY
jgi:hypothetical protein